MVREADLIGTTENIARSGMLIRAVGGLALCLVCGGVAWSQTAPTRADAVTRAIDATQQTQRAAAASQQKVDQLDEQTRALLERYRAATWQAQQLTVYAGQLDDLLASQQQEVQSLQRQIVEMDRVEEQLLPLMLRMLDSLEKFVKLDLPFLQEERNDRLQSLRRAMSDPEVGTAERFRRLLEAYQIETDYGRTLGVERAEIDGVVVDVLRVGRTALFSLALDGKQAARWDAAAQKWEPLSRRHVVELKRGIRIAREVAAPDLLVLPMPVAGAAP